MMFYFHTQCLHNYFWKGTFVRTYPQDSPQAAARIVAMAALADGHMCSSEAERLTGVAATLGLQSAEWQTVLRSFCEDVLVNAPLGWSSANLDAPTIAALLGEIRDPALRRTVVDLCAAIVAADSHHAEGESLVLKAAKTHWRMDATPLKDGSLDCASEMTGIAIVQMKRGDRTAGGMCSS